MKIFRIVLYSLVALVILFTALTYIPITRRIDYSMQGYLISREGKILEEFPVRLSGKDYNFIIDPPGNEVTMVGNKVDKIRKDACVLSPQIESQMLRDIGMYVNIIYTYALGKGYTPWIGGFYYYNIPNNRSEYECYVLDPERGIFCLSTDSMIEGTYLVAFTDPDADPFSVPEEMLIYVREKTTTQTDK